MALAGLIEARWQGCWLLVYAGEEPAAICFFGVSGD